jgi:hypothetical protein
MVCAAAAVSAPSAMAGTVSNVHPMPTDPVTGDPTPGVDVAAPASYTASAGENNSVTLQFVSGGAVFSDGGSDSVGGAVSMSGSTGGFDTTTQDDTCLPDQSFANWTCPLATDVKVDLGDGDDTLALGAGLPGLAIDGGTGTDRLDFVGRTDPVSVTLGGTTPGLTVASVENVTGGDGGDKVVGNADRNVLDGGPGADRLSGGDGNDELTGDSGVNVLRGGAGDDTLNAGDDGDTLVGGAGTDTMTGGAGDDDISAADGVADQITCGAGFDTVSADASDTIAVPGDCEEVTIAGATAPDPTPTPTPTPDPVVTTTDTSVIFVPVLGSIAPVLAPGPANIADLTPPSASMRSMSRQRVATVLKRGGRVPVRVTCREACGISVALSVDRTTAKRLKLDSRTSPVVIGTASAKRALAGSSVLRVKLTSKAKAGLKASKRNSIVTTQVLVSDASGNGTLLSRHITLVR